MKPAFASESLFSVSTPGQVWKASSTAKTDCLPRYRAIQWRAQLRGSVSATLSKMHYLLA